MTNKKYECSDVGDEIIHSYVQLISDDDSNIKQRLILELTNDRHKLGTNWLEGPTLPRLQHQGRFLVSKRQDNLSIAW